MAALVATKHTKKVSNDQILMTFCGASHFFPHHHVCHKQHFDCFFLHILEHIMVWSNLLLNCSHFDFWLGWIAASLHPQKLPKSSQVRFFATNQMFINEDLEDTITTLEFVWMSNFSTKIGYTYYLGRFFPKHIRYNIFVAKKHEYPPVQSLEKWAKNGTKRM